jgi:hypothetical protein
MSTVKRGRINRAKRKDEAKARATHVYSPEEQVARLDARLGVGVGASKERAILDAMLNGNGKKRGKRS